MFRILHPLLILAPIGLVVAALSLLAIGRFRSRRGVPANRAYGAAALDVLVVASVLGVLVLTLRASTGAERTVELVPFRPLLETSPSTRPTVVAEMAANMMMFIPLGLLVPAGWRLLDSLGRVTLAAAGFSILIEAMQFALNDGRQASTTDVLMNTAGAVLGYSVLVLVRMRSHAASRSTGAG